MNSPGLTSQWGLGNSISIRLHSSSALTNKTTVLNTEHVGIALGCRFLEWSTNLRCVTSMCCRPPPALQRQKYSSLGYYSSSYLVCCFVRSLTRRRTISVYCALLPVFILFCLLQQFNAAKEQKGLGSLWTTVGQPSNKKLPGCVSGLLAAHLLMRDGWCLCCLC